LLLAFLLVFWRFRGIEVWVVLFLFSFFAIFLLFIVFLVVIIIVESFA
jgi:hypothetical protein